MESVKTDGTIEIAIVENPHAHIRNTKFLNRKKVSFTEFNLVIVKQAKLVTIMTMKLKNKFQPISKQ